MKKKNHRHFLVLITSALFVLSGCYYDNEEELYPGSGNGLACDTTGLTFPADIMPIVNTKCAISGCHTSTGGNGIPITNQSQFDGLASDGDIRNRVLVQKNMPPSGPLPLCEQQKIDAYLKSNGW
jgi:hypothetical protein